ncbi:MAG: type II toxin-antitoxin system VapC family toxin [Pseudonocardia sp.]
MSAVLLDTHALLWALLDPQRIPAPTREHISDPGTTLLVSAATAWEIGTKFRLGKLPLAAAVVLGYPDHLQRVRARELAITSHHALTAGGLAWHHRDPFDRIIAAQCMIESVPLCTADPALAAFPGLRVIW